MSSSQWGHEDELEAARDAGYELGYDDGWEEALGLTEHEDGFNAWMHQLCKDGVNVLDSFVCRWDAAERKLIVEQSNDP